MGMKLSLILGMVIVLIVGQAGLVRLVRTETKCVDKEYLARSMIPSLVAMSIVGLLMIVVLVGDSWGNIVTCHPGSKGSSEYVDQSGEQLRSVSIGFLLGSMVFGALNLMSFFSCSAAVGLVLLSVVISHVFPIFFFEVLFPTENQVMVESEELKVVL